MYTQFHTFHLITMCNTPEFHCETNRRLHSSPNERSSHYSAVECKEIMGPGIHEGAKLILGCIYWLRARHEKYPKVMPKRLSCLWFITCGKQISHTSYFNGTGQNVIKTHSSNELFPKFLLSETMLTTLISQLFIFPISVVLITYLFPKKQGDTTW